MNLLLRLLAFAWVAAIASAESANSKFAFGSAPAPAGFTAVAADAVYTSERGFGFEPGAALITTRDSTTSKTPFYFSAAVPAEGNYRVTITFPGGADLTVKAELRRLMLEHVQTAAGQPARRTFIVNTRTPRIAAIGDIRTGIVKLKVPRETTQEAWAWDNLLTLEFNGRNPAVTSIEIEPATVPTIFIIGDSTVCDQSKEPYNSWGQMFTRFFTPEVAIANHGESGETYRDSIGRRRLDKLLSVMKPGDWMLMQFGHNDQKQIAAGTGGPFTTYKEEIRKHVDAVRAHGGTPVIISPMERRNFTVDGKVRPTLNDYAEGARQAATELGVAFIDLHAMSIRLYEALGPDKAYVAFAGDGLNRDPTHHNNYGSYQLAKCIVQALRELQWPIANFIVDDFKRFDPAHPDAAETFAIPASPTFTNQRPLGDEPSAK